MPNSTNKVNMTRMTAGPFCNESAKKSHGFDLLVDFCMLMRLRIQVAETCTSFQYLRAISPNLPMAIVEMI
jgi:hypothetical protein